MNLTMFPRRIYTRGTTPIEKLERFSSEFAGPNVYIKRDDQLGLTEGGNKTRKLEFLIADAKEKGADTIITAGGIQSNHCRLTLAACVKEGMHCLLVLEENKEALYETGTSGNILLFGLLGSQEITRVANGTDLLKEMNKLAEQEMLEGRTPYVIPIGGSNVIGATGYVACANEIMQQAEVNGLYFDYVVCASGSGGMHAGLLAGFHAKKSHPKVIGINVSRGKFEQEEKVFELATQLAKHVDLEGEIPREAVTCFDEFVGPGYAFPTNEMIEAVTLLARTEAVLLDPVYTGKAMAGVIALSKKGYFKRSDNVLFLHSGGTPALYAYSPIFGSK